MGFFKKDRPVIVPVASKFDRQWSDEPDRDVFAGRKWMRQTKPPAKCCTKSE